MADAAGQSSSAWWRNAVVYEIYVRSFQDSNADGVGDLPGLISRLDYLNDGTSRSLGVNALWLAPIYPSPLRDYGYDVSDYMAIDPVYGTMENFEHLCAESHERGVKIIMDLVVNHTSDEHAWFRESRSTRSNPRRDWYVWRDPGPNGGPPNNWLSVFGGPAWTLDEATGQYYLHSFLAEQPDLNWRNPALREAVFDVVRFWTSRGVDGFRLDAISHIAKDEALRDNPGQKLETAKSWIDYEQQLHRYDRNDAIIHEWLQALRRVVDEDAVPRVLISEIYGLDERDVSLYHGSVDTPEMHMSFNFDFLLAEWDAGAYRTAYERFAASLPSDVWPNVVLNNHDQSRFASRHDSDGRGEDRARLAALLMLTVQGTAFLYYGEELGMKDGEIPRERLHDPVGIRYWPHDPGRDPERTPMQWRSGQYAGFSEVEPWLPVGPDAERLNVEAESGDEGSTLSLYRRLIHLREGNKILLEGSYRAVEGTPTAVWAFIREVDAGCMLVATNFGIEDVALELEPSFKTGTVQAGTDGARPARHHGMSLRLGPLEGVVLVPGR